MQKKRYDNIQVLRVIAVMGVFICHFAQKTITNARLNKALCMGSLCVELFFVISGFLAVAYFDRKEYNRKTVFSYYRSRCIRILPLYYFVIVYFFITETFIFKAVPEDPTNIGWFRYVFLLAGNISANNDFFGFWCNVGSTWTVMVFATLYALMPIIYLFAKNFNCSCILTVIFYGLRIALQYFDIQYFHTFTYFAFFSLGFMAYYAIKEGKINLFLVLIALSLAANMIVKGTILEFDDLCITSIVSSILIVATKNLELKNSKFKKVLAVLDEYSYTIYLCQGIVFCGIIDKAVGLSTIAKVFIIIFATAAICIIVHNLFEKPINKLLIKGRKS